jgi:hypothetical protein
MTLTRRIWTKSTPTSGYTPLDSLKRNEKILFLGEVDTADSQFVVLYKTRGASATHAQRVLLVRRVKRH